MRNIIGSEKNTSVTSEPKILIPIAVCQAFGSLTQNEITNLNNASVVQDFKCGDFIIKQNEVSNFYYVIIEGFILENHNDQKSDKDHSFQISTAGFLFEKDILFGTKKNTLSYKALTSVKAVRIEKKHIENLFGNARFKEYITNELKDEVARLRWRASNNTSPMEPRVSKFIVMLSETFGKPQTNGCIIKFKINNTDMAHMLDSTRESVNRTLNILCDKSLIEMNQGRIFVSNRLKEATSS